MYTDTCVSMPSGVAATKVRHMPKAPCETLMSPTWCKVQNHRNRLEEHTAKGTQEGFTRSSSKGGSRLRGNTSLDFSTAMHSK